MIIVDDRIAIPTPPFGIDYTVTLQGIASTIRPRRISVHGARGESDARRLAILYAGAGWRVVDSYRTPPLAYPARATGT